MKKAIILVAISTMMTSNLYGASTARLKNLYDYNPLLAYLAYGICVILSIIGVVYFSIQNKRGKKK